MNKEKTVHDDEVMSDIEPHVGLIYIIGEDFYQKSEKISNMKTNIHGLKEYADFYEWWTELALLVPKFGGFAWGYYPRGVVTYSEFFDLFWVGLDECINDMSHIELMIKRFHLDGKKIELTGPKGLICAKCLEKHGNRENLQ